MRVLALTVGPVVWLAALVVRHLGVETAGFTVAERARFDSEPFAAPEQLAAYARQPGLVTAGYALFALGAILLCATVLVFAREIGGRLALVGGALMVASLFSRALRCGIDLTAFELVDRIGVEQATAFVMESYVDLSYGLWRIPVVASGWCTGEWRRWCCSGGGSEFQWRGHLPCVPSPCVGGRAGR